MVLYAFITTLNCFGPKNLVVNAKLYFCTWELGDVWHHVALLDDPAVPTEVQGFCCVIKAWEKGRASTACSTVRQHHSQTFTERENEITNSHVRFQGREREIVSALFRDSIRCSIWESKISRPLINRRLHLSLITSKQLPVTSH